MIWILLATYQLKHLAADYFLQGSYMLGKFQKFPLYIKPLLAHAGVHASMTFLIGLFFVSPLVATLLGLLDGAIHFIVDRIKASPDMLGRFKALSTKEYREIMYEEEHYIKKFPGTQTTLNLKEEHAKKLKSNIYFWWALGADQMAHHLTHYLLIYLMLR